MSRSKQVRLLTCARALPKDEGGCGGEPQPETEFPRKTGPLPERNFRLRPGETGRLSVCKSCTNVARKRTLEARAEERRAYERWRLEEDARKLAGG